MGRSDNGTRNDYGPDATDAARATSAPDATNPTRPASIGVSARAADARWAGQERVLRGADILGLEVIAAAIHEDRSAVGEQRIPAIGAGAARLIAEAIAIRPADRGRPWVGGRAHGVGVLPPSGRAGGSRTTEGGRSTVRANLRSSRRRIGCRARDTRPSLGTGRHGQWGAQFPTESSGGRGARREKGPRD